MKSLINHINDIKSKGSSYAYKMGYDCGLNGASETNCNFAIFSSPENTKQWEEGKKDSALTQENK